MATDRISSTPPEHGDNTTPNLYFDIATGKVVDNTPKKIHDGPSHFDLSTGQTIYNENPLNIDAENTKFRNDYVVLEDKMMAEGISVPDYETLKTHGEGIYAEEFSFGSKLANAGERLTKGAYYGVVSAVSGWDLEDTFNLVKGDINHAYGSELSRWADRKNQELQQDTEIPIFGGEEAGFRWDMTGLSNFIGNSGTTIGIFAEGAVESLLLGAITGGAGGAASVAKNAKLLKDLSKLGRLKATLKSSNFLQSVSKQSAFFAFKGLQESQINAYETYNQIFEKYRNDPGYTEEQAQKLASIGAVDSFQKEAIAMMALNSLQAMTLYKNPITGNSVGYLEKLVKNQVGKAALAQGANMAFEGGEEYLQAITSMMGRDKADQVAGKLYFDKDRTTDYFSSGEAITAGLTGVFSAPLLAGIHKATLGQIGKQHRKAAEQQYYQAKMEMVGRRGELITEITQAEKSGDKEKAQALKKKMSTQTTLDSLYLDSLNDDDFNYDTHIKTLENTLNAVNSNNKENLKGTTITEDDYDHIKSTFPEMITQAKAVKNLWEESVKKEDKDSVYNIVHSKLALEDNKKEKTLASNELLTIQNSIEKFTPTTKELVNLEAEEQAIKENITQVQEAKNNTTEQGEFGALNDALTTLSEKLSENQKEQKDIRDSLTPEEIKKQEQTNTKAYARDLAEAHAKVQKLELVEDKIQKNIDTWRDPSFIEKHRIDRLQKVAEDKRSNAKAKEEVIQKIKAEQAVKGDKKSKFSDLFKKKVVEAEQKVAVEKKDEILIKEKVEEREVLKKEQVEATPGLSEAIDNAAATFKEVGEVGSLSQEELEAVRANTEVFNQMFNKSTEVDYDYSPASFIREADVQVQLAVKKIYDMFEKELGHKPSFREIIEKIIEFKGKEEAERLFNFYSKGWELNRYAETDFGKVYDSLFSSLASAIEESILLSNSYLSLDENPAVNEQPVVKVIEGFDENGTPKVEKIRPSVIVSNGLFGAFKHQKGEMILTERGDLTIVDYEGPNELTEYDITDPSQVDNSLSLLPNSLLPGTKLTLELAPEDTLITIYDADGIKKGVRPFNVWAEGKDRNSNEVIAKTPVLAKTEDGRNAFYLQDNTWFAPANISLKGTEKQTELIRVAKENNMAVRKSAMKGSLGIEISSKEGGVFVTEENHKPISEVTTQSTLSVYKKTGFTGLPDGAIVRERENLIVGKVYELRVGVKPNEYVAFSVNNERVSEERLNTLSKIAEAFADRENPESLKLRDKILAATNKQFDIHNASDVRKYFSMFIPVYDKMGFDNAKAFALHINTNSAIKKGHGAVYIDANGSAIYFAIKGETYQGQVSSQYLNSKTFAEEKTKSPKSIETRLNILRNILKGNKQVFLPRFVNGEMLEKNPPVFDISLEGEVISKGTYIEEMKTVHTTDVKAFNVNGTDVTLIQPSIAFKVTGANIKVESLPQAQEIMTPEAVALFESNPKLAKEGVTADIETQKADIERRRQEELDEANERFSGIKPNETTGIGRENITMVGEVVSEGSKIIKDFIHTPEGYESGEVEVVVSQRVSPIYEDGKLVRAGEVTVMLFSSREEGQRYVNENPVKINPKRIERINAKYDAELKALEQQIGELVAKRVLQDEKVNTPQVNIEEVVTQAEEIIQAYDKIDDENNSIKTDRLKGISIKQEKQIVDFLVNRIVNAIEAKYKYSVNRDVVVKEASNSLATYIDPFIESTYAVLENLNNIQDKTEKVLKVIADFQKVVDSAKIVKYNNTYFENKALAKIEKETGIIETTEEDGDGITENNYSKSKLEESVFNKASYKFKRFIRGIEQLDRNGNVVKGAFGIPLYEDFSKVWRVLEDTLTKPSPVTSDFDVMIARLRENSVAHPFLTTLANKLQTSPVDIQKQFQFLFVKQYANFIQAKVSKNKSIVVNGKTIPGIGYTVHIFELGATESAKKLQDIWANNLTNYSSLVFNGNQINVNKAAEILKEFETMNSATVTNETLIKWLGEFGMHISPEVIETIRKDGLPSYMTNGKKVTVPFVDMFHVSPNTNGIFGLLAYYTKNIVANPTEETILNLGTNSPFTLISGVLKGLSSLQAKYSKEVSSSSHRDGGKTMYQVSESTMASDITDRLNQDDPTYRQQYFKTGFAKNSIMLKMLDKYPMLRQKFGLSYIANTAIKDAFSKFTNSKATITDLYETDYEVLKVNALLNDMGEKFSNTEFNKEHNILDVETTIGQYFFPTPSDKTQMPTLKSVVFKLQGKNFKGDKLNDNLLDLLFDQLVLPELNRMYDHEANEFKPQTKGYNEGVYMFHTLPFINDMTYTEDGVKMFISDYIQRDSEKYSLDSILLKFKESIKTELQDMMSTLTNETMATWEELGVITNDDNTTLLDSKTLKTFVPIDMEMNRLLAYNYVFNNMIAVNNIEMLYTGDPAFYYNQKLTVDEARLAGKSFPELLEDASTNFGKRLASLIAPGGKRADSDKIDPNTGQKPKYLRLHMEDVVSISNNLEIIAEGRYPGNTEIQNLIARYREATEDSVRASLIKSMKNDFPLIAGYASIEGTDAQEYTTIQEHLDSMFQKGRIEEADYNKYVAKAKSQLENGVTESNRFASKDLDLIMQPEKPVHTGLEFDETLGLLIPVYVKSSSFPLIPQVVQNTELDKLRLLLEDISKKKGMNIRASYQTANKVGAVNKPLSVFDKNGKFVAPTSETLLDNAVTEMSYTNLRNQQDIPTKFVKKAETKVSLMTQAYKILMGNGISQITEKDAFTVDGVNYSGVELTQEFDKVFTDLLNSNHEKLLKDLGLGAEYTPASMERFMKNVQDLLIKEARTRGLSQDSENALKIYPIVSTDADGKQVVLDYNFEMPLWASPDGNKYESLLNSIINSRLINLKLPGTSLVAGSELGWRVSDDLSEVTRPNDIIYTSNYKGGELEAAKFNEDGTVAFMQVYMPSRFIDNSGKLIDLTSDTYSETVGNKRMLKEGMIDKELLSFFSARIPTSSHVSLSNIEVVGFLPNMQGDLLIVPKNLTTQKGLDFDIDKENLYFINQFVGFDGKVSQVGSKAYEHERQIAIEELEEIRKSVAITSTLQELEEESEALEEMGFEDFAEVVKKKERIRAKIAKNPDAYVYTLEDLKDAKEYRSIFKDREKKLLENRIVKIHKAVVSSNHPKILDIMSGTISMDFAEGQKELLSAKESSKYFTHLDPNYQRRKMQAGAVGKMGIGVYSKYVTLVSLLQQNTNDIRLTKTVDKIRVNKSYTIGNLTSDGDLRRTETLSPKGVKESLWDSVKRDISTVFGERQNTATDNEKAQIMGALNITEDTIGVDAILAALGFDQDIHEAINENGESKIVQVSIGYALLSQPIIREYVKQLNNQKAIVKGFVGNKEKIALDTTILKFRTEIPKDFTEDKDKYRKTLTGEELLSQIKNPTPLTQRLVLDLFLELKKDADAVREVQSIIDINNGVGKTHIETLEKFNKVPAIFKSSIKGAGKLLGDHIDTLKNEVSTSQRAELLEEGYREFGNILLKPTTIAGTMVVNSLQAGKNIWGRFFPQESLEGVYKEILKIIDKEDSTPEKLAELKQEIFDEFKKYAFSAAKSNLIGNNPEATRFRLFKDIPGVNQSLPSYILQLKQGVFADLVSANPILSRLEFVINNEENAVSVMKFNVNETSTFDEETLYEALIELYNTNEELTGHDFNGVPYNTRELALDMVRYHYSSGGAQEAVQYGKYIPISMLQHLGATKYMRGSWTSNIINPNLGVTNIQAMSENFVEQFLRHKVDRVKSVKLKELTKIVYAGGTKNIDDIISVTLPKDSELRGTRYIKIRNPQGVNKNILLKYNEDDGKYYRIQTLGTPLMSEYSLKNPNPSSLLSHNFNTVPNTTNEGVSPIETPLSEKFEIGNGSLKGTLKNVSNSIEVDEATKKLAGFLSNIVKEETIAVNHSLSDEGRASRTTGNVELGPNTGKSSNGIAKTIVHEALHTVTSRYLEPYIEILPDRSVRINTKSEFVNLSKEQQNNITKLISLHSELRKLVGQEGLKTITKKMEDKSPLTPFERDFGYAAYSIYEMIPMAFETGFITEASSFNTTKAEGDIISRIKEAIYKLLNDLASSLGIDSSKMSYDVFESAMAIIQDANIQEISKMEQYRESNDAMVSILGAAVSEKIEDNQVEKEEISSIISNLLNNQEDSEC